MTPDDIQRLGLLGNFGAYLSFVVEQELAANIAEAEATGDTPLADTARIVRTGMVGMRIEWDGDGLVCILGSGDRIPIPVRALQVFNRAVPRTRELIAQLSEELNRAETS